jgi:hypothetical protein
MLHVPIGGFIVNKLILFLCYQFLYILIIYNQTLEGLTWRKPKIAIVWDEGSAYLKKIKPKYYLELI